MLIAKATKSNIAYAFCSSNSKFYHPVSPWRCRVVRVSGRGCWAGRAAARACLPAAVACRPSWRSAS